MQALSEFAQSLLGGLLGMSGVEIVKMLVMWAIGGVLIFLAIKKGYGTHPSAADGIWSDSGQSSPFRRDRSGRLIRSPERLPPSRVP